MKKLRGFTLVEAMVVIAIIAILAMIAAPSFKSMIQTSNVRSAVNSFLADMQYARSESIRRGGGVVMCPSANPEATAARCKTTNKSGWESGWIIFHDLNNGGTRSDDEPILRVQGTVNSVNTVEAYSAKFFEFSATGRLPLSSATHLTFGSPPDFDTDHQRVVCIAMGGRVRIALDSTGKANGDATCTTD